MMEKLYGRTKGIRDDMVVGFCPGCMHGTIFKLIGEVLEELGMLEQTITVHGVGCCGLAMEYVTYDCTTSPHGRACAVATGVKRAEPDKLVFTYQGDGDLASIGTAEIVHAAHRGEKITTIFVNNAIYGMTGGQMAPTTLIGQRATTAVDGRTREQAGMPLRMCELLSTIECAVFVERVMLNTPANVRRAKKVIHTALDIQQAGLGFTFVEFLSACPTNWGLTPAASLKWLEDNMASYYPVKNFRKPEGY